MFCATTTCCSRRPLHARVQKLNTAFILHDQTTPSCWMGEQFSLADEQVSGFVCFFSISFAFYDLIHLLCLV